MERLFFFRHTSNYINKKFAALFRRGKQGTGKSAKSYGWVGMKFSLAQDKVFDHDNKNSIKSVEDSELYEVLMYANIQKELSDATQDSIS